MYHIKTRLLSAALALVLLCGLLSGAAPALAASDGAVGGEFGSGMTWTLEDGVLTIEGNSYIPSYEYASDTPWYAYNTDAAPITALVVGDGVTGIGTYAFEKLSFLKTVDLGKSVSWVNAHAFTGCSNISGFTVDPDNQYFCHDENGWLFSKDMTSLVKYIGAEERREYTVPDTVTRIEGGAFAYTGGYLEKVTIHENMDYIGDGAFAECGFLSEVNLLGCRYMGSDVFMGNELLKTVYIGPKVQEIGASAFYGLDRLSSVTIADGVGEIGSRAFEECDALTEITIPGSVKRIGTDSFSYCYRLTTVNIEEGVESIGESAFEGCFDLISVTIPGSVDGLGADIFKWCEELKNVTIGEGLGFLGTGMFQYCNSLQKISLPDSLISISNYAFDGCPIKTITIPENVTLIGRNVFREEDLTTIIFEGDVPSDWGSWGYAPFPETVSIYYRASKSGWSTPTWESSQGTVYNAYPILGEGEIDFSDETYYAKLAQRHFSFVKGGSQPVYGASLTMGEATLTAEPDSDSLAAVIPADTEQAIRFFAAGMHDVTIPAEMFDTFNTVEFHPDTTAGPFVQAVYGRRVNGASVGDWADLLHTGMTFAAMSETQTTQLYVDVNWNGADGTIWLTQHADGTGGWELTGGWCEEENYSSGLMAGLPLYIVIETTDGQLYVQELKAVITPAKMDLDVDLIPDIEDIDVGADVPALSEFSMSIKFPGNIGLTFSMSADGTVKGLLGVTAMETDKEDAETIYDLVKETLYSTSDYEDSFSYLEGLISSKGGIVGPAKAGKLVISVDTKFLGWLEGQYVLGNDGAYHIVFREGAVAMKTSGQVSYVYQAMTPIGPAYVKPSFEPYVQFTLPLAPDPATGMIEAQPVKIVIHLPLKLAVGYGWESILSAGIFGEGGATLEGDISSTSMDGYIQFKFGMEAAFFCLAADFTIAETERLYFSGGPSAQTLTMADDLLTRVEWTIQSRDYLNAPSLSQLPAAAETEDGALTASAVTEAAIYPYADVQMAELVDAWGNSCRVAVWTEDDPGRASANRTVLYYSYDEGYGWSDPEPVNDDGTADFDPVLKVVDSNVYLVWKNADRALTEEDTVDTIPGAIDLRVALFSTSRYSFRSRDMVSIGTDSYDTCADLTGVGEYGQPCVVWVSNSANNAFGGDGTTCSIYCYNILEETTELLAEGLCHVDGLAADGDAVWFTADTDGDAGTVNDRELFCLRDGSVAQVTDDGVADSRPMVANGQLAWYSDGVLQVGGETLSVAGDTSRIQYLSTEGLEAVLYVEDDGVRKSTLYALFNDGTGWGQPLELTGTTGNISSFSAALLSDGTLAIAACERVLDSSTSNYLDPNMAAYLRYYTLPLGCELVVTGADYVSTTMVPGGRLAVTVDVENRGGSTVQLARITVTDGAGAELVSAVYQADLPSGGTKRLLVNVDLPEDLTVVEGWTVTVAPEVGEETDTTNNSAALSLRLSDLSLEGAKAKSDGSKTTVVALVVNRGQTDLTGIAVTLTDGETLLASTEGISLKAGEGCFVELEGKAVDDQTLLTLEVSAEGLEVERENVRSNNRATVLVDGIKPAVFRVSGTAAESETGATAILTVYNSTAEAKNCILCVASYDINGRMLDVKTVEHTAAAGSSMTIPLTLTGGEDVAEVRIFAVDTDYAPIQEQAIIPIR